MNWKLKQENKPNTQNGRKRENSDLQHRNIIWFRIHDTFGEQLMNPTSVSSKCLEHGIKFEPVATRGSCSVEGHLLIPTGIGKPSPSSPREIFSFPLRMPPEGRRKRKKPIHIHNKTGRYKSEYCEIVSQITKKKIGITLHEIEWARWAEYKHK